MTDFHPGNAALRWTSTFFRALVARGVEHVIISPGSRSTPLTLGAALNDRLQKHVILDERSAAFTALGIGKATNVPAVLVCTSGTAVANYYPTVIEARQSGIPLILATADRPPGLRRTGANQAIDQLKIFGDYPVFFHEVGQPESSEQGLQRLKLLAKQAMVTSREKRGPVHLNFPFRKPLEPEKQLLDSIKKENEDSSSGKNYKTSTSIRLPAKVQRDIEDAKKPLIIVGSLAPNDHVSSIKNIAKKLRCPILSESSIDTENAISYFDGFLRNKELRKSHAPDLILRFGFQPATKGLELSLNDWNPDYHYHFSSTDAWQDATFSDSERIPWYGRPFEIPKIDVSSQKNWLSQWKRVENDFSDYYENKMRQREDLTDGSVYHELLPQIDPEFFTAVSNSFPARDIHLFGNKNTGIPLFKNRGASGIDGIPSTVIGLNLGLQKGGVLFTGDLAFLHDTNALLNKDLIQNPLVIVVINNSGGSIFRMLPVHQHQDYFKRYFETPQSADISKLADANNIPYKEFTSLSALKSFGLKKWINKNNGLSILECKTDADSSMNLRKKLWNF